MRYHSPIPPYPYAKTETTSRRAPNLQEVLKQNSMINHLSPKVQVNGCQLPTAIGVLGNAHGTQGQENPQVAMDRHQMPVVRYEKRLVLQQQVRPRDCGWKI